MCTVLAKTLWFLVFVSFLVFLITGYRGTETNFGAAAAFVLGYDLVRLAQAVTLALLVAWAWSPADGGGGTTLPRPGFVLRVAAGTTFFAWLTLMTDFPVTSSPSIYLLASAVVTAALALVVSRIRAAGVKQCGPESLA